MSEGIDPKDVLPGWAKTLIGRVQALELVSHAPIDLTPAIDEILDARGYVPTVTEPALTPSARLAKLLVECADYFEDEAKNILTNDCPPDRRAPEHITEVWALREYETCTRLAAGLREAITSLTPPEAADA